MYNIKLMKKDEQNNESEISEDLAKSFRDERNDRPTNLEEDLYSRSKQGPTLLRF